MKIVAAAGLSRKPSHCAPPLPDCISAFTYSAVMRRSASVFLAIVALTAQISFASDYSSLGLEEIKQMPQSGRYSVSHFAKIRLEFSERRTDSMANTSGTGRVTFPLATAREVFREAKSPTQFSRVLKCQPI